MSFDDRPAVHPDDDPATPERRREIARYLLNGAISRYDAASEQWSRANAAYPHLDPPRQPIDATESAERKGWRALLSLVDEEFDSAEQCLAIAIMGLYNMLADEDRRAGDEKGSLFIPRAVRRGGNLYLLVDDPWRYEPRTNFIAVYRESMVIDLSYADMQ